MDVISGSGDIHADMERFCAEFGPFLQDNHKFLVNKDFKNFLYSFITGFDSFVLVFILAG